MTNTPALNKQLTADQREALEGDLTYLRHQGLEANPIRGNFDAAHLKEVNRYLFQDFPAAGLTDVTPGEFRSPVEDGRDWLKPRGLSTQSGVFLVAYSRMDANAQARLDTVLKDADPDKLRHLNTAEFTARLGKIYAELDYIHPFSDGNSRTLRAFTKQLANESGYEVDWERFNRSPIGRDLLYIARDLSVNELALPHLQSERNMRDVAVSRHRLQNNRPLPDLLRDAVRPSRALAFERMPEVDALAKFPELGEAYKTLRAASADFQATMPGKTAEHAEALKAVRAHVQTRLNAGVTSDFKRDPEISKAQVRSTPPTRDIERER